MNILIKNAKIIAPQSKFHNSKKDILIVNGVISKVANSITDKKAKIIKSDDLHVSPGWLDIGTMNNEPGFEHRETLKSLVASAASGGYTAIAPFPNSNPIVDEKSSVQYILNQTQDEVVDFYPIGAISKKCHGEEITEMIDMKANGAVAFSDGHHPIASNGLMMRALQYVKSNEDLIINCPNDTSLSNGNDVHEGAVSTSLGLKGSPSLSETLMVERDIQLSEYTESKLHIHNISAKESIEKISTAKNKNISASVPYLNLCLTDASLQSFDPNFKVSPPLREEADREALTKALNGGKIEVITSNHHPLEQELKKKEFVYADPGATGLQTCFSALNTFANKLSINRLVTCLSINPRKILGLPIPDIDNGAEANLTLFDPSRSWVYNNESNKSLSKNSPFWNTELKGKIIGIINKKLSAFNS